MESEETGVERVETGVKSAEAGVGADGTGVGRETRTNESLKKLAPKNEKWQQKMNKVGKNKLHVVDAVR